VIKPNDYALWPLTMTVQATDKHNILPGQHPPSSLVDSNTASSPPLS
jgi:hypothetical protein